MNPAPTPPSGLISIGPPAFDAEIALAYATAANFTGRPVYRPEAGCWLHRDAALCFARAIDLARPLGLRFRVFDAFRPQEAQWALWNHTPDPDFVADPRRGSPHSRGAAIDLTLIDSAGHALDMGTEFDDFTPRSHHGDLQISPVAQRNRHLLLGLMSAAGWDFFKNEWWHYQLFDARARYPLLEDSVLPQTMMA
jgi:D-alanyl-D-alanine dipeptidase